jgi:hypothetical protein
VEIHGFHPQKPFNFKWVRQESSMLQ